MKKEPKRLRPMFVVAMIGLARKIDKVKTREALVRSTLQYGKCGTMKRDEVEWVLDHSFFASIQKEWKLEEAERERVKAGMAKRDKK